MHTPADNSLFPLRELPRHWPGMMARGNPSRVADPHRPFLGPPGVMQGDILIVQPCFLGGRVQFCTWVSGPQSTRQPRSHEARQRWGDRHGPPPPTFITLLGEHSLHTNILAELLSNSHTVIHTPPLGPLMGPGPILARYQGMGSVSAGRTRSLQMSRFPFWPPSCTSPRCL